MTYLALGTGLAIGYVIGDALKEGRLHDLALKVSLYRELYRNASLREREERNRAARAEAQARDHQEVHARGFQGIQRWE